MLHATIVSDMFMEHNIISLTIMIAPTAPHTPAGAPAHYWKGAMLPRRKRARQDPIWDDETVDLASRAVETPPPAPSRPLEEQASSPPRPPQVRELAPVLRERFCRLRRQMRQQVDLRDGKATDAVRMTNREIDEAMDELERLLLWLALLDCTRALALSQQEEFQHCVSGMVERSRRALLMVYGY